MDKLKTKILLISLMLILLLSLQGAAAASDDGNLTSENIDLSICDNEDYTGSNSMLTAANSEDILGEDKGSFRELQDLIDAHYGRELTLNKSYKCNGENAITIEKPITIYGNGYTLDGNWEAGIFYVPASKVVVHDIIFVNGKTVMGGAMFGGTAINCTFTNNTATEGGAMYSGTAINCTFTNNHADNFGGGAMINGYAVNCTFTNNHAYGGGGAMGGGAAVNCTFTNNHAGDGGAMSGGTATNCTFTNNGATEGGAMIEGYAVNCTFTNNNAVDGGAMYGGGATNCTFTNNTAYGAGRYDGEGGAMYGGTATNCTFTNNTGKNGGAMYVCTATNCTFTNNNAYDDDGGVMYGGNATNCIFKDNLAWDNPVFQGTLSTNCTIISEFTTQGGYIVYPEDVVFETETPIPEDIERPVIVFNQENEIISDVTVKINGTTVTVSGLNTLGDYEICYYKETINSNGDKNYNRLKVTIILQWEHLNLTINGNNDSDVYLERNYTYNPQTDGEFKDGIIINRNVTIHGNGHTLDGNHEARIFYVNASDVEVHDIIFVNGNTDKGGAMIDGYAVNCTFTNNTAYIGGAMIDGYAVNCTFTNNGAYNGGAIYNSAATNCTFTNNNANDEGGAMYEGTATNCTFTNNGADQSGGAMSNGHATNCTFTNNKAYNGGAICEGHATNCTFTNNNAKNGGAICFGAAVNSIFKDNLENGQYNDLDSISSSKNCIFISTNTTQGGNITYPEDVVFETETAIPEDIERPVIVFNQENEIINDATVKINDKQVTVSGLNAQDNYEICYYHETINSDCDKNYNRFKVGVLKANSTVWAEDVAVLYGNPISIPFTSVNATNVTYRITNNKGDEVANATVGPNDTISLSGLAIGKYTVNLTTVVDENHVSASNASKLIITDGTTYWDLNRTINGNADEDIYLDEDYTYNPDVDSDFKYGIRIDRNVTIHGNGHTLDGHREARILNAWASDVEVHDTIFANGMFLAGAYDGSAMYGGTAINCTFTNNEAGNAGGAMYGGTAINCTFTNNHAYNGGAIYNSTATNCTFTNNTAEQCGGAMEYGSATNCTFRKNTAYVGGAIYNSTATNCTFTNNLGKGSAGGGGGMFEGNAVNCLFKDNFRRNNEYDDFGLVYTENCIVMNITTPEGVNITYSKNVVFETETPIPEDIERPVIVFNQENEIISDVTVKINGKQVTVSGLNNIDNYEICYYSRTLNDRGDKYYNRVKVALFKANITIAPVATGDLVVDGIVNVTFTLPTDIDGDVSVTIDDEAVVGFAIDNGTVTIPGSYDLGNHTVNVNLTGDTHYNDATGSTTFNIGKGNSTITITNYTSPINIGDDTVVAFKINRDVMDNTVTLWINNTEILTYNFDYNEDSFLITKDKFPSEGTYNITVQYRGNSRYNASNNASCIITVDKVNVTMNVEGSTVYYGENATITVTGLPDDATGNVSVRVGDGIFFAYIKNGTAVIEIPDLLVDTYEGLIVKYFGDSKYNNASGEATIIVKPAQSSVSAEDVNVNYGEAISIEVTSTNATEISYKITDSNNNLVANGTINPDETINLSDLDAGEYTVNLTTVTDENHSNASNTSRLHVKHVVSIVIGSISGYSGEVVNLTAEFKYENGDPVNEGTASLTIKYDDKQVLSVSLYSVLGADDSYSTDVSDGKAVFNVKLGAPGIYPYVVTYSSVDVDEVQEESTLIILKLNTTVSGKDVSGKAAEEMDIAVDVLDQNNNPANNGTVTLNLNGEDYNATVDNGKATINVKLPSTGSYNATIRYDGNDYYSSSESSISVDVEKINTGVPSAEDVSGKAGEKIDISIKLDDENGNPVKNGTATLTIDGKTYTAEVVNGTATFKDVVLPENNTVADFYYQGNDYYNSSSTTFSIKITQNNNTEPTNNTDENKSKHVSSKAVDAADATGNPIVILVMAFSTLVITYRKK